MNILVVTPHAIAATFCREGSSRILLDGLDRHGIRWQLQQPWCPLPAGPAPDAVLYWPYALKHNNFLPHALAFEQRCQLEGVPMINSLQSLSVRHSTSLRIWGEAGLPCARFQHFTCFDDIALAYPLLLRVDGVHRGRKLFMARTPAEARRIIRQDQARLSRSCLPPLDLAIEFIDTRYADGFYRKRRSHVVGGQVIPRQQGLSADWKINLHLAAYSAKAHQEDRAFIQVGEPNADLLRRAAALLHCDILALDYSRREDGSYFLWEANRNYQLSVEGEMLDTFMRSTGRSYEEALDSNLRLGDAIARLIIGRSQARPSMKLAL